MLDILFIVIGLGFLGGAVRCRRRLATYPLMRMP